MITKLGHATIYVLDQDVAHDFYVNKLGFKVATDMTMDNGFRWLTVTAPRQPDLEIILMKVAGGEFSPLNDDTVGHLKAILAAGNLGVGVFECDDCRATYADLLAKGVKFKKEPTEEFYGVEALFTDPFGNWFSMSERKAH
jgi:catechol 2,3-dioxygenase-like lactoylglutathione lyase family enzyme